MRRKLEEQPYSACRFSNFILMLSSCSLGQKLSSCHHRMSQTQNCLKLTWISCCSWTPPSSHSFRTCPSFSDNFKRYLKANFWQVCDSCPCCPQYGLVSGLVSGKGLVCIMSFTTLVWFGKCCAMIKHFLTTTISITYHWDKKLLFPRSLVFRNFYDLWQIS